MLCVSERFDFDEIEFKDQFLDKQPIIYRNISNDWSAVRHWSPNYFKQACPDIDITVKYFKPKGVEVKHSTMSEYVDLLDANLGNSKTLKAEEVPYCHDIPIFWQAPQLIQDVETFPVNALPKFYQQNWQQFVQFFMSPAGAVTPLHFDTLRSQNLFFQIKGEKCFSLIPWKDRAKCLRRGWRWFDFDPEDKNQLALPEFSDVEIVKVNIKEGDVLYIPAGMLHHVRTLEDSISFNIDFHTKRSVVSSFLGGFENMPAENHRYNWLCARGLFTRMSQESFFKGYKHYLNYVS
ncbi:MAG: ribosomal protein L16 Arg81 hydroxylase [Paraglaciecola sp.]|jgi:ribosomal protein L16 Arg81 hydroxylase